MVLTSVHNKVGQLGRVTRPYFLAIISVEENVMAKPFQSIFLEP